MSWGDLTRRALLELPLASAVLGMGGASAVLERTRVSMVLGRRSTLAHLPLTLALQLGYFKAEGLEVELTEQETGVRAREVLATGGADVYAGSFEHLLKLSEGGARAYRSFVLLGRAPQSAVMVSVRAIPHYRGPADLKGRRIGVSALGSLGHLVARLWCVRSGLRLEEVEFVPVGAPEQASQALRFGRVAALAYGEPLVTRLEQKGDLIIVADTRTLRGTELLAGGLLPASCLITSLDYQRRNPNTVQAMTHAAVRALKWLHTAAAPDILGAVPPLDPQGDRALYLSALAKVRDTYSPDGLMPEEGPRTALRAIEAVGPGWVGKRPALDRLYTNDFVRQSHKRFFI